MESMSRSEVLMRMVEEGSEIQKVSIKNLFFNQVSNDKLISPSSKPIITTRMINPSDIIKLIFGRKIASFYLFTTLLCKAGSMVAYTSIFSTSFASNIPIGPLDTCDIYSTSSFLTNCKLKYWFYLVLFGICVVYMTVKGIEEQQFVQITTSLLRFVVIFIIIFTCIADLSLHKNNQNDQYNDYTWPPLIVPKNIGHGIAIITFATSFTTQLATISNPIKNKEKNLPLINIFTTLTCLVFYLLLGLIGALAINNVPSMVSLNYRNYTAGHNAHDRPFWTYIIEYTIILCPAIDVFSSFPLKALTLSDSITSLMYGDDRKLIPHKKIIMIRLVVSVCPLFIAFLVFNLGTILD